MVLYEGFGNAEARGSGVQNSQRKTKATSHRSSSLTTFFFDLLPLPLLPSSSFSSFFVKFILCVQVFFLAHTCMHHVRAWGPQKSKGGIETGVWCSYKQASIYWEVTTGSHSFSRCCASCQGRIAITNLVQL